MIPARTPPPERPVFYNRAAPPAGFVDPYLFIDRYLRPRSSLSAAGRWSWSLLVPRLLPRKAAMGSMGSTSSAQAREVRRVLAQWQRSGLRPREFGEQRGIALSALRWWRRVFRAAGAAAPAVAFTEVPAPVSVPQPPASISPINWLRVRSVQWRVSPGERPFQDQQPSRIGLQSIANSWIGWDELSNQWDGPSPRGG